MRRSRRTVTPLPALSLVLALALALVLLAAGCSRPFATPTAAPTDAPTPTASPTPTPPPTPTPDPFAPPAAWQDGGIFSASYRDAMRILSAMTLEEKVGQVILARCSRTKAVEMVSKYRFGGFTLYAVDFEDLTADQVVARIRTYQSASRIPLAIATDEEGGGVVRVSKSPLLRSAPFHSPHYLYLHGGFDAIRADSLEKAALLLSLGVNVNLAPVADVSTDPADMIHGRTLGQSADLTARFVEQYVATTRTTALSSTLKHFPGYGDNRDTHMGAVVDDRPLSAFEDADLLPFAAGVRAGVEWVMVSHVVVRCMDPDRPASLSPAVHARLREGMGYTGVVMTDSLGMGAISAYTEGRDPHVEALLAGNDLLATPLYEQAYAAVLDGARSGLVPAETLDRAVFRVLAWKLSRGIIPADAVDGLSAPPPES